MSHVVCLCVCVCVFSGLWSPLEERLLLKERWSEQQASEWGVLSFWQRHENLQGYDPLLQRYTHTHTCCSNGYTYSSLPTRENNFLT